MVPLQDEGFDLLSSNTHVPFTESALLWMKTSAVSAEHLHEKYYIIISSDTLTLLLRSRKHTKGSSAGHCWLFIGLVNMALQTLCSRSSA